MKKIIATVASALALVLLVVCFAACSSGPEGTYKFSKMTITSGGKTITYEAGQEVDGVKYSEDMYVLELKSDNTYTLTAKFDPEDEPETQTGTWSEKDGKIVLTEKQGDKEYSVNATLDGDTITVEAGDNSTIVLKK